MRRKRSRLAVESLEDRRLLAQTPELLFDVKFDYTFSDAEHTVSEVQEVNGLYFAWVDSWDPGTRRVGKYEVIDPQTSDRWIVDSLPAQRPDGMLSFNDSLYLFYAEGFNTSPVIGQEVWKTDGRTAEQVKDISKFGFAYLWSDDFYSFVFQERMYFSADDELEAGIASLRQNVWVSDGTEAGTLKTGLTMPIVEPFTFNEKLYFLSHEGDRKYKVYVADNALEEAQPLGDFNITEPLLGFSEPERGPAPLFEYDGRLYFYAATSAGPRKLWSTDGQSPPTVSVLPNAANRAAMPGEILFDAPDLLVSATHQGRADFSCFMTDSGCPPGAARSWVSLDIWVSQNTDEPQYLGTIVDELAHATLDGSGVSHLTVQRIDDRLIIRMLTSREQGNNSRVTTHVIDLPTGGNASIPGDADSSGAVDFADFLVLSSNFEQVTDALWADGDFNGDRNVDFADFLLLSAAFGEVAIG